MADESLTREVGENAVPSLRRDVPAPTDASADVWGSDAIAALLRDLDIPYVLLNPGSSFRGLHDSLVNFLGNERPQMLVCLHEEHVVAIAHGYAKVTGKPLLGIVHSNVGLMHASMAIYNAWADRMPVILLGATGPVDASKRRPWIDWLHTARDQAAMMRGFLKWDDQPASVAAAFESLLRARQIAETSPKAPVYVCLDVTTQEEKLASMPRRPDPARYRAPPPARPAPESITQAAQWLTQARRPVILMGRVTRDVEEWNARVALAEALNAKVLTDLKVGASFPTDHPLHAAPPGVFLVPEAATVLRAADVVLSLDWVDLAGTLKQAWGADDVQSRVIQVSSDQLLHNAVSMDHQGLPPTDLYMLCEPELAVDALANALPDRNAKPRLKIETGPSSKPSTSGSRSGPMSIGMVAEAMQHALRGEDVCLLHLPLGWGGEMWHFRHPLDFVGSDGGGGIGAGPGISVGAAIALKGTSRLPVSVMGDGDFLMGVTALWTAANAGVPLLGIVTNNRSYFNDEVHQERVAKVRGRPVANRWIGQRIDAPAPDLAAMARAQGLEGIGPVTDATALPEALAEAVRLVKQGRGVVVDVHVEPGYNPAMAAGITRSHG
jgi:thiamine pyrophosphate-dependent acetolactate synthase large subunit-like protein